MRYTEHQAFSTRWLLSKPRRFFHSPYWKRMRGKLRSFLLGRRPELTDGEWKPLESSPNLREGFLAELEQGGRK